MCTRRKICFAILLVVVCSVSASLCPENKICSCEWSIRDTIEIICKINNSSIDIEFESIESIKVTCSNANWSDFQLYNLTKRSVKNMYFYNCDLPKDSSLKTITDMLGATNVEKLVFHSYKNLSSFKRLHLNGFVNLRLLDLSNNIISSIDTDLLADLPNLIRLNLRKSNLITVTPLSDHDSKLQELDLGENRLEWIKPDIFDKFYNLTWLSLEKNNLTKFKSRIFDKLVNVLLINLFSNNLVSLPENIFGKLKNLETLSLAENNFTLLPRYLLQNNTNLRIIDLSFNKKKLNTLPDGFFRNLTKLEMLKVEKDGLTLLPEDLLWGCFSLTSLTLSRNDLGFLPKLIFRDLKELRELKLDSNAFRKLPNIFQDLKQLKKLDLSKNYISFIDNEVFKELEYLEELNMAENSLILISERSFIFLHSLQIANFSHNNLTLNIVTSNDHNDDDITESPFASCYLLKKLYLSHNRISEMFSDWVIDMEHLQKLDLRNNYISHLSAEDLQFASENIEVDLTYNKIRSISLNNAKDIFKNDWSNHAVILIEHNPLHCDCELYDYLRYLEGGMNPIMEKYINIDPKNLTCFVPLKLRHMRIIDLQSKLFTCTMNADIYIDSICPDKCSCFRNLEDEAFIIDCFGRNFTVVPSVKNIPHKFWQIKLNLSNNQLTEMPNLKELGYGPVRTLILSNNNISEISLNKLPESLEVLELHNNKISKMSSNVLNFLTCCTNLYLVTLHGNPFICNCSTTDFFTFIHTFKSHIIADLHRITCQEKNKFISKMTITDFCPNYMDNNTTGWSGRNISLIIFVIVGLFISIIGLLYYMYRKQFKRKLYEHRSIIEFAENDEEDGKEEETNIDEEVCYDVFVSYSQDDHVFVMNNFVHVLENGLKPLKLYLPYRDWSVSEWTTANIIKSAKLSGQMMMVLSPSFLENVWGKMELRVALCQAWEKYQADVILILYGEIEPTDKHLDSELRNFINANIYIKWGDPWFWKKLGQLLKHDVKDKANRSEPAFLDYPNQGSSETLLSN
ncbi:protein toll-like [Linepithema humile]|uniref:protein toll-like n=1 Tax=Linepithema humile TaxID=83485 RepID=UPI0006235902|nr:PREDICTED: protein toll-like [Linepithema humile]